MQRWLWRFSFMFNVWKTIFDADLGYIKHMRSKQKEHLVQLVSVLKTCIPKLMIACWQNALKHWITTSTTWKFTCVSRIYAATQDTAAVSNAASDTFQCLLIVRITEVSSAMSSRWMSSKMLFISCFTQSAKTGQHTYHNDDAFAWVSKHC